jgi:hypothetical protein
LVIYENARENITVNVHSVISLCIAELRYRTPSNGDDTSTGNVVIVGTDISGTFWK